MKKTLAAFVLLAACITTTAAFAGETVSYKDGDVELEGYWAAPAAECPAGDHPVVMVIHQWKGLTDYEKGRADQLAAQCYNAFAVDMYGKGIRPQTTDDAGKEATKYKSDSALARKRITAALDYARAREPQSKIAAMGYCFGGTMALELARSGADVAGVVSFHGGLGTPAPVTAPGVIKASVQVHHGADDPLVPPEEVRAFIDEMNAAKADWVATKYAGAVHAFTQKDSGDDPSKGFAYNEKADHRSWNATMDFLNEVLGQ